MLDEVAADPICGNCGNPLSRHYKEHYLQETRIYCNLVTSGDTFTDEPQDGAIMAMLLERHPDIHEALEAAWKRENGHPTPPDQKEGLA